MFLGSHLCDSRAALGRAFISHFGLSVEFALKLTPLRTPRGPNLETSVRLKAPHFSSQFNFFFVVCVCVSVNENLSQVNGKSLYFSRGKCFRWTRNPCEVFISIGLVHPTIPVDCDMVLLRENEEKKMSRHSCESRSYWAIENVRECRKFSAQLRFFSYAQEKYKKKYEIRSEIHLITEPRKYIWKVD